MTATTTKFISWLNEKLKALATDESVFGSYITGILEGDETYEEKHEALTDILSEIQHDKLEDLITAILSKWEECHPPVDESAAKTLTIDVNAQLAKLLEAQKFETTVKERQYTEEERRIREQILAQYSQTEISDEDADDVADVAVTPANADGSGAGGVSGCGAGKPGGAPNTMGALERNTNAADVMQLQKERREQARMDSAAKKQKDKEDREKQKQLREEKKEKRKTVKGERRR